MIKNHFSSSWDFTTSSVKSASTPLNLFLIVKILFLATSALCFLIKRDRASFNASSLLLKYPLLMILFKSITSVFDALKFMYVIVILISS